MKHTSLLFILLIIAATALAQRQAAEIYFQQDSIVPNKIQIYVRMIAEPDYTGAIRDSLNINWGDGNKTWIALADTIQIPGLSFPLFDAVYSGFHIYDTTYLDSSVTIGCVPYWPREGNIVNIAANPALIKMFIGAELNFTALQNIRGYRSPYFSAPLFVAGYTDSRLSYDPLLTLSNSLYSETVFSIPLEGNDTIVPGYIAVNKVFPITADTLLICDSITGVLTWDHPQQPALYDIALKTTQYQNSVVVSSVMLDMELAIFNPSGISDNGDIGFAIIYPNPSVDLLHISALPPSAALSITDMTGRIISMPEPSTEIEVSTLPAGIYFLHIQNSEGSTIKRFIKE